MYMTHVMFLKSAGLLLLFDILRGGATCSQETIEAAEGGEVNTTKLELLQSQFTHGTRLMSQINRNSSGDERLEVMSVGSDPRTTYWHCPVFMMVMVLGTLVNCGKCSFLQNLLATPSDSKNASKDRIADDVGVTAIGSRVTSNAGLLKHEPPSSSSSVLDLLPDLSTTALCKDGCNPEPLSYSQLRLQIADEELSHFWGDRERVALVLDNGKDMAVCMLAVMQKACAVPLNPSFTAAELKASMEQLSCSVVIARPGSDGEAARNAANNLVSRVLTLNKAMTGKVLALEGPRLQAISPTAPHPKADATSDVLVLKTSGTTSKGKVVTFSFERLSLAARYNARCVELGPNSICLSMMPLYHIAGISVNFLASMSAGASVLFYSGTFDVTRFVAELERSDAFKPTWYFAVPAVHDAVLSYVKGLGRPVEHRLSLIRSAGAALMQQTGLQLIETFNCGVTPAYGMTEALEISCPPPHYQLGRPGSVGPSFSAEIQIINDEVCVRGDLVMPGYEFHGPEGENPNSEAWTGGEKGLGFLRTGDLGHMDKDGWLFLTGRSKEMINRGGETINPHEVEPTIASMPGIDVAVCMAAPHKALGECVAAAIVLKEGFAPHEISPKDVLNHCTTRASETMRPEVFVYLPREALPTTATRKFIRAGLAQRLGLTSELLLSGSVFIYNETDQSLKPGDLACHTETIKDSLGELREASVQDAIEQQLIDSLYCIGELQVMNVHWRIHLHESGDPYPCIMSILSHVHGGFGRLLQDRNLFLAIFTLMGGYGASHVKSLNDLLIRWAKYYVIKTVACMISIGTNSIGVDWFLLLLIFVEFCTFGFCCAFSLRPKSKYFSGLLKVASIVIFIILAALTNTTEPARSDRWQHLYTQFNFGPSYPLTTRSNAVAGNLYVGEANGSGICGGQIFMMAAVFAIGFHMGPKLSKFLWSRPDVLHFLALRSVRLCSVVSVIFLFRCLPAWPTDTGGWWWLGKPRESIGCNLVVEMCACVATLSHNLLTIALIAIAIGPSTWPLHKLGQNTIGALVSHAAFADDPYGPYHYHVKSPWPFHDVIDPLGEILCFQIHDFQYFLFILVMIPVSALYMSSFGAWAQKAIEQLFQRPFMIFPVWAFFVVCMQVFTTK